MSFSIDRKFLRGSFFGVVIVLFTAAIATVPILLRGHYCGDDYQFHLISWLDAQQSWRHGIPYPHWASSANYGAGEPRFVFYPPLIWMLGAALGLVFPWNWVPAALTFLLLAATGLAILALARRLLPGSPALLAACAALLSVYALFTAYERSAFPELSGGFWIPLLLLFALRERNPSASFWRRVLDGSAGPLALVVAGCWLSNLPVGVMASYTLAAVALAAALAARSWVPVARAGIAAALGLALAGLFLVPALWEQRWIDIGQANGTVGDPGLLIENHWLFPPPVSTSPSVPFAEAHVSSLITSPMIVVALVSVLAFWWRRRLLAGNGEPQFRRWWIPLSLIPVAVLYLQLPISLPLWNLLPKLRFLQFPWRWLLVLEAPMAIFFAAAIWPGPAARRWQRRAIGALCTAYLLLSIVFAASTFFRACQPDDSLPRLLTAFRSGHGFWGADEYAPPGGDNSLIATGLPDACFVNASDTELGVTLVPEYNPVWQPNQEACTAIAAQPRHPEHLRITAVASHSGFWILRLRSYPAWKITLNGLQVTNLPARDDGLITVPVSQGPIDLRVDWTTTRDVIIGREVSALALLLLVILWFWEFPRNANLLHFAPASISSTRTNRR